MPLNPSDEMNRPVRNRMRPVETSLVADLSVGEALDALRRRPIKHKIVYFYVVDGDNRLQGVLATRTLLLSDPGSRIGDIMHRPCISIPDDAALELALDLFALHRLLALPVVDEHQRLVGVLDVHVYADEMSELADHTRMADMFQIIGLSLEQVRQGNIWRAYRLRMPWLLCNLFGGLACAVIAAMFDNVLSQVILLAMFIPLVLTLSESVSIQSLTLSLGLLHSPGIVWRRFKLRLTREWRTGALLAATSGLLVAASALFWGEGLAAPAVIGASVVAAMVMAGTIGAMVPAVLHLMRLDPKVAAGPVVLTLTDICAMLTYLGLGTWWLL